MSTVNYLTARSSNLAAFNTIQLNVSTLTGSTIQTTATANTSSIIVSTLATRAATYSTLTGSTITSNNLVLSTLTVSSINSGAPGVAEYSTLNVSSMNATSTITASSINALTGRIGIGTANPAYKLDLVGDARASGSLLFGTGGTYTPGCIFSNGDWGMILRSYTASPAVAKILFTDNADNHLFGVDNNSRIYISRYLRGTSNVRNSGISRLTINSDYNDSTTGFAINASDTSPDDYTMKLYPYVVAGGIVGYAFGTLNGTTNYTPLSFNRDRVGVNNINPSQAFNVQGTSAFQGLTTKNSTDPTGGHLLLLNSDDNYVFPTINFFNWTHDNQALMFDMYYFGGFLNSTAGSGFMQYKAGNSFDTFALRGTGTAGSGGTLTKAMSVSPFGIVQIPQHPFVKLYGSGGQYAINVGTTWGLNMLYAGQSVGLNNNFGNGWNVGTGAFYAPILGRWQINVSFYWNNYVAGNRMFIRQCNSAGTVLLSQYCHIEGNGISLDTVREYSTMLYMAAGDYFYIFMASGSGSSLGYFDGYEHSHMTIHFVG